MKVIIEFIKNNLAIFISTSIAILGAIFNFYQYLLNRKLKKYSAEKDLKQKNAELVKLIDNHYQNSAGTVNFYGSASFSDFQKEENKFYYEKSCLEVEIEYLEKILKIKNK